MGLIDVKVNFLQDTGIQCQKEACVTVSDQHLVERLCTGTQIQAARRE